MLVKMWENRRLFTYILGLSINPRILDKNQKRNRQNPPTYFSLYLDRPIVPTETILTILLLIAKKNNRRRVTASLQLKLDIFPQRWSCVTRYLSD